MVVSVHIADVGLRTALGLFRRGRRAFEAPGLRYAEAAARVPLGGTGPPLANPGNVGLIASWDDDAAIDRFVAEHPLAPRLAGGWHVRLEPTRVYGHWPEMPELPAEERPMESEEPAVVLTLGRPRIPRLRSFIRTSRPAEKLAVSNPSMLSGTALVRPPIAFAATFTVWRTIHEMRDYALGRPDPSHLNAIRADSAEPFHHHEAFARFRPYRAEGKWDGANPLADHFSASVPS